MTLRPARFIERVVYRRIVGDSRKLVSAAAFFIHFCHGLYLLVRIFKPYG